MGRHFKIAWGAVIVCFTLLCAASIAATTIQYTYDAAGRLLKVDYGGGRNIAYTYDANGNFLTRAAFGEIVRGDVNADGSVNLADAIVTLRILSGLPVPSEAISDYMAIKRSLAPSLGLPEALYILQDIVDLR